MLEQGLDPHYTNGNAMYQEGPELKVARFLHGCVSVGGAAVVLGGFGLDDLLRSIEIRDKETGEWTLYEARLPSVMAGFGAYSLRDPNTGKYTARVSVR